MKNQALLLVAEDDLDNQYFCGTCENYPGLAKDYLNRVPNKSCL